MLPRHSVSPKEDTATSGGTNQGARLINPYQAQRCIKLQNATLSIPPKEPHILLPEVRRGACRNAGQIPLSSSALPSSLHGGETGQKPQAPSAPESVFPSRRRPPPPIGQVYGYPQPVLNLELVPLSPPVQGQSRTENKEASVPQPSRHKVSRTSAKSRRRETPQNEEETLFQVLKGKSLEAAKLIATNKLAKAVAEKKGMTTSLPPLVRPMKLTAGSNAFKTQVLHAIPNERSPPKKQHQFESYRKAKLSVPFPGSRDKKEEATMTADQPRKTIHRSNMEWEMMEPTSEFDPLGKGKLPPLPLKKELPRTTSTSSLLEKASAWSQRTNMSGKNAGSLPQPPMIRPNRERTTKSTRSSLVVVGHGVEAPALPHTNGKASSLGEDHLRTCKPPSRGQKTNGPSGRQ